MDYSSSQIRSVVVAEQNRLWDTADSISTEVPVALVYNGISHVVLMATPQHLGRLALGFSFTEGLIESAEQIYDVEVKQTGKGVVVNIELAAMVFQQLKERRRSLSGRTGCGICGLESLDAIEPPLPVIRRQAVICLSSVRQALADFEQHQPLCRQTGSVHGVAWVGLNGCIQAVFEDVGRHNALDKLIGWGLQQQLDWQAGFVLISSRASFEMVAKSAMAGIGCIVAVSAPTGYAIDLAEKTGMTLIGFAHAQRQTVYSHAELVQP